MNLTKNPGMNKEVYFFDTYAIFEIIRGSPNYSPYKECKIITTIFNMAELNYNLKKKTTKEIADETTKKYDESIVGIEMGDIINASDLKTKYRDLSIPDAIGYVIAKRYGVKFLTGDEGFKDFENVEFVK